MCTGQMLKYKCVALYCALAYIAACVDISGMVLFGPFNRPTANRAQVKGDLNTKGCIRAGFRDCTKEEEIFLSFTRAIA